jgi:hypothetical protein
MYFMAVLLAFWRHGGADAEESEPPARALHRGQHFFYTVLGQVTRDKRLAGRGTKTALVIGLRGGGVSIGAPRTFDVGLNDRGGGGHRVA